MTTLPRRAALALVAALLLLAGCDCGRKDGCFGDGRFGEQPAPTSSPTAGAR